MRRRDGLLLVSDSSLELHQLCSAKFWFQYLEKPIVESRVAAFEFGSAVHKMFEEYFVRKDPTAKMYRSADDYAKVFVGRWMGVDYVPKDPNAKKARLGPLVFRDIEFTDPETGRTKRMNEKMVYLAVGRAICKRFFTENAVVPPSHVLVERHFEIEVGPDPDSGHSFMVQGYIDRIELRDAPCCRAGEHGPEHWDYTPENLGSAVYTATEGELLCVDYKTGKHAPSQEALDLDTQFSTYDLALERLFPQITRRVFAIHNVRDGAVVPTIRAHVDREQLFRRIYEQGRKIENEEYRFQGDMYVCERCPFLRPCGALRKWAQVQGVDPQIIMRREAPLAMLRSRKLITWRDGQIAAVDADALLGNDKVFGYARHNMAGALQAPPELEAPIPEAVKSDPRRKKSAEQLSLLG